MKRKIIQQGKGGFTIYLPKKWVDKKGLKSGDEITISETDVGLLIGSAVKKRKAFVLNITEENKHDVKHILTHLYRRGFERIVIQGTTPALLKEIEYVTKHLLLGFEIIEKSHQQCTVENISEPTEEKYDVLLRRSFLIIKETHRIIAEDFKKGHFSRLKEVENMRLEQDKFILFCKRILTKEKYERDPVLHWELLTFLMHIEHAYHQFYMYGTTKQDRIINILLDDLGKYFDYFYKAYYTKDIDSIHKINKLRHKYQFGECLTLLKKGKNAVTLSYIKDLFRLMQIGTSPIFGMVFEEKLGFRSV